MGIFSALSLNRTEAVLVIHVDVGTGNCRAALLTWHGDKKNRLPRMLYTAQRNEKISRIRHVKHFPLTLASLREQLTQTREYISKKAHDGHHYRVGTVYVVLGSPYYLSHTALIKYREPKGFVITPDLVSSLVHSHRTLQSENAEQADLESLGQNPVTVAERIIHTKVNGYAISAPYGKRAKMLDLSVFKTEVASSVIQSMKREVEKFFACPLYFEPLSLAIYVGLRDHVHFEEDFLFVVVGSEITEISLVRNGSLLETVSFPFGKNALIRHVARDIKSTENVVKELLPIYARGELQDEALSSLNAALSSGAQKWFPFFEKALVSLSDFSTVPQFVYVVGDPEVSLIFKSFIETDTFAGQSLVPTGFEVIPVDTEKAKTVMQFEEDASCDTLLCLEGLFALSTKLPVHQHET